MRANCRDVTINIGGAAKTVTGTARNSISEISSAVSNSSVGQVR